MATDKGNTDRRIVRSKLALRNALLALMEQKPFSAISITEIVELADYNRGTFYKHYESKKDLLEDLIHEIIADLIESFRAPYRNVDSFQLEDLSANAISIFDHMYQNSSVYTSFLHPEVLPEFREKIIHALTDIALEDFEFPQSESGLLVNRELFVIYTMNALLGLIFHWIQDGFKHSPSTWRNSFF